MDSLGNLMEEVARRVTKAVQHYEDCLKAHRSAVTSGHRASSGALHFGHGEAP